MTLMRWIYMGMFVFMLLGPRKWINEERRGWAGVMVLLLLIASEIRWLGDRL